MADPADPIFDVFFPMWEDLFRERRKDYGDTYKVLGSKGQFSDISRKYWKLKHAIWDGKPLVGEQVDEICMDIISHCFLLMQCQEEGI